MVRVVCNASPIIGLSILGKLNFLWELFDVIIPGEVYNEVVNLASGSAIGSAELKAAVSDGYIRVYKIIDREFANKAYGILHKGELEVVVSALENNITSHLQFYYQKEPLGFTKTQGFLDPY